MISLIFGPDIFRARQLLDQLINQTKDAEPNIDVQKIDGATIKTSELSENLEPLALFAQKKLLIIKNLFTNNNQKKAQEILIHYLDQPNPDNHIIIWEQAALDKRSQIYKKIKKLSSNYDSPPNVGGAGSDFFRPKREKSESGGGTTATPQNHPDSSTTTIHDFPLLNKPQLITWTRQFCHQHQINIHPQAVILLINKTQNTFCIYNELIKAKTYSDNDITVDIIEKLTPSTPQEIIFDLTDQIGHKKNGLAYQTAINLTKKGEDPLKILAALSTHIENLIMVKELSDQKYNPGQIKEQSKLHPFVIKKCLEQSRNFSLNNLKRMHQNLATTDYKLKTGQSNFETEMFNLIKQKQN